MGVFLVIQVIVCVLLIGAVLLQVGKGASTGAVFGGGTSTFFGPSGGVSFLGKMIIVLATIFIINAVLLYISFRRVPPPLSPAAEQTSRLPINQSSNLAL